MIRKILLFMILLTAGFFTLFALIDDGDKPSAGQGDVRGNEPEQPEEAQDPGGILLNEKGSESAMEVRQRGRLHIPMTKEVDLGDGRMKLLPVYILDTEDSEPGPNNTQLLKKVRVEFFEVDDTQGEPRAKRTSLLTADRALVQLSQDERA
ncbi:MAG: hypothetical protein ACYS5W_23315 [Planctomycetota bacterium]|jgi:hypothetical protein